MVTGIVYTTGDATVPPVRPAVIAHVCNDVDAWGKGFVFAVSRRWPFVARHYRAWLYELDELRTPRLGAMQCVHLAEELWVANLTAQHGIHPTTEGPPIRYDALA